MDPGYELYCLTDSPFYDSPMRCRDDDVDFEAARRPVPSGWGRAELDDCLTYTPGGVRPPVQGWKVHVSACLDNAEPVLAAVYEHCTARGVAFKFVRSRQLLLVANAKYADRGSSGKFVTIYPAGEAELESVISALSVRLQGQAGPYILSDLRIGEGPLYVRYGGFAERWCIGPGGEQELAIEDGVGRLVPDRRSPTFEVPDWVELPDFLRPHLEARNAATVEDLPYRIERALHFSNGGGLYAGIEHESGDEIVLKEARPHAGLAVDGSDAPARLRHERYILDRLAGLDVVPAVRGFFGAGGHDFLAIDMIEGEALSDLIVYRYPLAYEDVDVAAVEAYTAWVLDVHGRVEQAVEAVHARGVVIGDVHPHNILIRPDGRVVLIDFEVAGDATDGHRPTLGDPAFVAPSSCRGFAIDRHALACLRLFMFLPLTTMIAIDAAKAAELAADIAALFPVPGDFLAEALRVIDSSSVPSTTPAGAAKPTGTVGRGAPRDHLDHGRFQEACDSMVAAVLASATPERDDRLFPGDPKQFSTNGIDLAHGAAGVLYALDSVGAGPGQELVDWLVRRALDPQPGTRLGFYDGLHGVAHVLEGLGLRSEAFKVLDICANELGRTWEHLGLDLYGGLSGIGLNLDQLAAATGDAALRDEAERVAQRVADRLGGVDDVPTTSGGDRPYAGMMRGSSGPALLFLRLYERAGDRALLELAGTALRQDLRRCVLDEDGSMGVDEGWRTMPYLADGSVGIGVVLDDYLGLCDDDELRAAQLAIHMAAEARLYVQPGLFHGRAGMILYLSRAGADEVGQGDERDPVIDAQVRRLAWHALSYQGHLAFPGEELLRLSMDLATGTAGVLLAVGAALGRDQCALPFLGPPSVGVVPADRGVRDRISTTGRR